MTIYSWDTLALKTQDQSYLALYQEGLTAYRKGDFQQALSHFEVGMKQKDPLAEKLYQRVQQLLTTSQRPPIWEGIWSLDKG